MRRAASHCELVDQLFSAEAFPSITENRKGLELSPEGLRMPIWGSKRFKIILNLKYNAILSQFQPKRVLCLVFLLATLCWGHYDWFLGVKNMHIIYRGASDQKSIYRGALTQKSLRTTDVGEV